MGAVLLENWSWRLGCIAKGSVRVHLAFCVCDSNIQFRWCLVTNTTSCFLLSCRLSSSHHLATLFFLQAISHVISFLHISPPFIVHYTHTLTPQTPSTHIFAVCQLSLSLYCCSCFPLLYFLVCAGAGELVAGKPNGWLYRRETFGGWEESGSAKGKQKSLSNKGWLYISIVWLLLVCSAGLETLGGVGRGKGVCSFEATLFFSSFSSSLFFSFNKEANSFFQHK